MSDLVYVTDDLWVNPEHIVYLQAWVRTASVPSNDSWGVRLAAVKGEWVWDFDTREEADAHVQDIVFRLRQDLR